MYGFAELRQLARKNLLKDSDDILSLPVTADQILNTVEANEDAIRMYMKEQDSAQYEESLVSLIKSYNRRQSDSSEDLALSAQVVAFDDESSRNELVYGIEVNQ